MSTTKAFECEDCGAIGNIKLKGDEYKHQDVVFLPWYYLTKLVMNSNAKSVQ